VLTELPECGFVFFELVAVRPGYVA
jgi:hypothetical protein